MNVLVESITPLILGNGLFHIRVWRQESESSYTQEESRKNLLNQINDIWFNKCKKCPTQQQLGLWILEIRRVNAVEIKDNNGEGLVLYTDWP